YEPRTEGAKPGEVAVYRARRDRWLLDSFIVPDDLRDFHAGKLFAFRRLDREFQQERLPLADGFLVETVNREGAADVIDEAANVAPSLGDSIGRDALRVLGSVLLEKLHDRLAWL